MFTRFTPDAVNLLFDAQKEAFAKNHPYISSEHLLLIMIEKPDAPHCEVFIKQGIDLNELRELIITLIGVGTKAKEGVVLPLTPSLEVILAIAWELPAKEAKIEELHLLLALLIDEENAACGALEELGFDLKAGARQVQSMLKAEQPVEEKSEGAANLATSSSTDGQTTQLMDETPEK